MNQQEPKRRFRITWKNAGHDNMFKEAKPLEGTHTLTHDDIRLEDLIKEANRIESIEYVRE